MSLSNRKSSFQSDISNLKSQIWWDPTRNAEQSSDPRDRTPRRNIAGE